MRHWTHKPLLLVAIRKAPARNRAPRRIGSDCGANRTNGRIHITEMGVTVADSTQNHRERLHQRRMSGCSPAKHLYNSEQFQVRSCQYVASSFDDRMQADPSSYSKRGYCQSLARSPRSQSDHHHGGIVSQTQVQGKRIPRRKRRELDG
jgi:hypothetical protein